LLTFVFQAANNAVKIPDPGDAIGRRKNKAFAIIKTEIDEKDRQRRRGASRNPVKEK
jgi:hypothetical protein